MKKFCNKCYIEKDKFQFYHRTIDNKPYIVPTCKSCISEQFQEYKRRNRDKVLSQRRIINRRYKNNHKDKINAYRIKYREQKNKILRERYKQDINFKLNRNIRARIGMAIKGKIKTSKSLELLGCSIAKLKEYLSSKFQPGMTWDNHGFGNDKWHIDHIKPCSSFDLSDSGQQKECFHYSNLQPLWQKDNLTKGNKTLL